MKPLTNDGGCRYCSHRYSVDLHNSKLYYKMCLMEALPITGNTSLNRAQQSGRKYRTKLSLSVRIRAAYKEKSCSTT